jgi:hypothetical protein
MILKPWILLNPNDFNSMWWRKDEIVDIQKYHLNKDPKDLKDIIAYNIIQDSNMGGNYWHFSTWFSNDPNRYNSTVYDSDPWIFNKELTDMKQGEIVYLTNSPHIKFIVYYCKFSSQCQLDYCKILERI